MITSENNFTESKNEDKFNQKDSKDESDFKTH